MHNEFGGLFKEIPKLISLNNISLTSILQNTSMTTIESGTA
jgi:hypothetical protein